MLRKDRTVFARPSVYPWESEGELEEKKKKDESSGVFVWSEGLWLAIFCVAEEGGMEYYLTSFDEGLVAIAPVLNYGYDYTLLSVLGQGIYDLEY